MEIAYVHNMLRVVLYSLTLFPLSSSTLSTTYVTSLVLAVSIVGTFSLSKYINVFVLLINLGFFIGTSVILLLVFTPLVSKMQASHFSV